MSFKEAQLETAVLDLLIDQGYAHDLGKNLDRHSGDVLIRDDLRAFLKKQYQDQDIVDAEIDGLIAKLDGLSCRDLYNSNKKIMTWIRQGFEHSRLDSKLRDLHIHLVDYKKPERNIFRLVNQIDIQGPEELRRPDSILYVNGLPLVVFEFKSAIRENATIHDAYVQLTTRYRRDIPELFKYNAFCVISDGVNNRVGSFFAPYEFFYSWRKVDGTEELAKDGINSLYTLIEGLFQRERFLDVLCNFIYMPDTSHDEQKILCRYPQYYAARKLYANILAHKKPEGDGKGGTYFGATGCGKSFTMLFLTRLLMRSSELNSPTIVLISDRTDLDDQLAKTFTNAKDYVGDAQIIKAESRTHLRKLLAGRSSGGVFLTTIHKFTEDLDLLTDRDNVICISDEAHRSQLNLDEKVRITDEGVKKTFGFAKYLHDCLPNATYVGFTGTPIDATLSVFGDPVDSYTMTESVADEITVHIVYEGRAAKVFLDNTKLDEVEKYYAECEAEGASDYAIEASKKANVNLLHILGDEDRLKALAEDFVAHYEARLHEGTTVAGKAMFVSSSRQIAYDFYKQVIALRPYWAEARASAEGEELDEGEAKEIKPMPLINMVMTRAKDDPKELYDALGSKEDRKELDRQFKEAKSNFKIAIVVDMWLTGFDVPFLDTMYIDKPLQKHTLIQTISRVNRKFEQKEKGLVVDYIGIKKQMNLALAQYSKVDSQNIEDIQQSLVIVRDHLDLLNSIFAEFNAKPYFTGNPMEQLHCLNMAAEFAQLTEELERRFMYLTRRLKAAYDICVGSNELKQGERDQIHFYMAIRSIVHKLTKGNAPDLAQMNKRVRELVAEALKSDGVEEVFKMGQGDTTAVDLFSGDYLAKLEKIKLPHTKIKMLQQLLAQAISAFKKVNKIKGVEFSDAFQKLVRRYNDRSEDDVLRSEVLEEFTDEIIDLYHKMKDEHDSFMDLGIDFKEKAFYDILKSLTLKYAFTYPEDKLLELAKAVKEVVDDKAKYTDWNNRADIKAELKVDLILLLAKHGYPPVDRDEVYKEIFEQAENFKKYQG